MESLSGKCYRCKQPGRQWRQLYNSGHTCSGAHTGRRNCGACTRWALVRLLPLLAQTTSSVCDTGIDESTTNSNGLEK